MGRMKTEVEMKNRIERIHKKKTMDGRKIKEICQNVSSYQSPLYFNGDWYYTIMVIIIAGLKSIVNKSKPTATKRIFFHIQNYYCRFCYCTFHIQAIILTRLHCNTFDNLHLFLILTITCFFEDQNSVV